MKKNLDFESWDLWDEFCAKLGPKQKKQQLLEMARNGEDRPNQKTHPLGHILCQYTSRKSSCYDAKFTEQIKELRPDWFITQSDRSSQKKQQLLEMARNGEPRPNYKTHPLGKVFFDYTSSPKNGCYDAKFTKQIKKLRPDWFITQSDRCNQKKQQLLEMARNGEDRPNQKTHPLGLVLCQYTSSNNRCYDAKFTEQIKKLRPDWFITRSDRANQKKQQLLEMARNGEDRPYYRYGGHGDKTHPLGLVLCQYTSPNNRCYDAKFTKQIKKLRPDWFITRSSQKKQQLLEMARNGEDRPNQKTHPLGKVLGQYINPNSSCYDAKFTEQIKELRPDWFKKC